MSDSAESSPINKLLPIIALVIILGGAVVVLLGLFTVSTSTMMTSGSASGSAGRLQHMMIDNDRWLVVMRDPAGKPVAVAIGVNCSLVSSTLTDLLVAHPDGSTETLALPGTDFLRVVDDAGVTVVKNPLTDDQLADAVESLIDGTRGMDPDFEHAADAADVEAMIKRW